MSNKVVVTAENEKLSTQLFNTIKASIFSGEFDTTEVFTEVSIAKRYNVSRTPAHDALQLLESEQFIEPVGKRGFRLSFLKEEDFVQLFDAAKAFEGATAEIVAKNHSKELIAELKEIISGMVKPNTDTFSQDLVERNRTIDFRFHTKIAEASNNPYLYQSVHMTQEKILVHKLYNPIIQEYLRNPYPFSACTHERILEAISLGDSTLARHLMEQHFMLLKELLKEYLEHAQNKTLIHP